MTLDTRAYLNLSALAYIDFNKSLTGLTIKDLIERKAIPKDELNNKPELFALQDPSNPLRSWKVIAQSPSSVSEVEFSIEINYTTISLLHHA